MFRIIRYLHKNCGGKIRPLPFTQIRVYNRLSLPLEQSDSSTESQNMVAFPSHCRLLGNNMALHMGLSAFAQVLQTF